MEIKLPSHEECAEMVHEGKASALEIFIHENEPAGNEQSEKFRQELVNLITEITKK